jgi:ABC-type transport system involved in cytochrome c biogenesis ATPase subunit
VLELQGLSRRFGDVVALDDISFSVPGGRMVGFIGPNGAGKTTAMRIMLGVLKSDDGDVRWRRRPVDAEIRRRFGYMPEERGLYPKMRVLDQLIYLARLHGLDKPDATAQAERMVALLGVPDRMKDRRETLSLGNQQRVQLAAALVHRPGVADGSASDGWLRSLDGGRALDPPLRREHRAADPDRDEGLRARGPAAGAGQGPPDAPQRLTPGLNPVRRARCRTRCPRGRP